MAERRRRGAYHATCSHIGVRKTRDIDGRCCPSSEKVVCIYRVLVSSNMPQEIDVSSAERDV